MSFNSGQPVSMTTDTVQEYANLVSTFGEKVNNLIKHRATQGYKVVSMQYYPTQVWDYPSYRPALGYNICFQKVNNGEKVPHVFVHAKQCKVELARDLSYDVNELQRGYASRGYNLVQADSFNGIEWDYPKNYPTVGFFLVFQKVTQQA